MTLEEGCIQHLPQNIWSLGSIKNWIAQLMKRNNLENFEYEIVDILVVSDNYVDVIFLALAKYIKSVYMVRVE